MKDRTDELTEGWPDEPGDEELAAFAGELRGAMSELPEAAMKRIESRMRWRMRRGMWIRRAVGVAAAVAAVTGGYAVLRMRQPERPTLVRDVYTVTTMPVPVGETPSRPLVAVEEYAGLIGR